LGIRPMKESRPASLDYRLYWFQFCFHQSSDVSRNLNLLTFAGLFHELMLLPIHSITSVFTVVLRSYKRLKRVINYIIFLQIFFEGNCY
jgi:hypothetical protein